MNAMDRFVDATEPVLQRMLKGTCVKATYRRTAEGGEVRLWLDLHSMLSFAEDRMGEHFADDKAAECVALVRGLLQMIAEASRGESRFARLQPDIEYPGTMKVGV